MSTEFLSREIWSQVSKAVRGSRQRCAAAVAYCGKETASLLPLRKGSRLVVDASERAVASGQTYPRALLRLVKRGVSVYSVPNLHAKVFVIGGTAFVGSNNASGRSALHWIEAAIRTTDPGVVRAARQFVTDFCLHELTPEVLKQLATLYRPPLIPGGKRRKKPVRESDGRPSLPRLLLAQLELEDWSEDDQALHDAAVTVAEKRLKHPRSFELDSFRYIGVNPYRRGDVVLQVTDEGNGNVFVEAPGNVLHVKTRRDRRGQVTFVFLERPARRRRRVKVLASALGCTQKRLRRQGVVREQALARALLNVWAVTP
jgi:hypothetical protein